MSLLSENCRVDSIEDDGDTGIHTPHTDYECIGKQHLLCPLFILHWRYNALVICYAASVDTLYIIFMKTNIVFM